METISRHMFMDKGSVTPKGKWKQFQETGLWTRGVLLLKENGIISGT
jgi:hypothetical protein